MGKEQRLAICGACLKHEDLALLCRDQTAFLRQDVHARITFAQHRAYGCNGKDEPRKNPDPDDGANNPTHDMSLPFRSPGASLFPKYARRSQKKAPA